MEPTSLMLYCAIAFVIFITLCMSNFARITRDSTEAEDLPTIMILHVLLGGGASLSSFGFICGFLWFLVTQIK